FGLMGKDAEGATKQIVGAMFDKDPTVNGAAAKIIPDVNPVVGEPVLALVKGESYEDRLNAVKKLGSLGEKGEGAVPALLRFKHDVKPEDAGKFMSALASVGANDKEVAAAITAWAVKDPDPKVRAAAGKVLGKLGDPAEVLNSLVQSLYTERTKARRLN